MGAQILFRNPIPKAYSQILFRNPKEQDLGANGAQILFRNPIPKPYSEILFRNPIPKSYSEILFRNPKEQDLGANGPQILFRNPIPKSYSEILFRNPIPKSYSEILFRNPIPKSYCEILFQNSSLQDLGTGKGGPQDQPLAQHETHILRKEFVIPNPALNSQTLFRNPIPKSYSEILFQKPQSLGFRHRNGGDPGSATCVTKNTHFTKRICHPKSSPQFPNPIPKSYSEILFRNPIPKSYPKSYSRNPIPKSYSEILFRNPIPKPQSLGFRHRNGGGTQDRPPA